MIDNKLTIAKEDGRRQSRRPSGKTISRTNEICTLPPPDSSAASVWGKIFPSNPANTELFSDSAHEIGRFLTLENSADIVRVTNHSGSPAFLAPSTILAYCLTNAGSSDQSSAASLLTVYPGFIFKSAWTALWPFSCSPFQA